MQCGLFMTCMQPARGRTAQPEATGVLLQREASVQIAACSYINTRLLFLGGALPLHGRTFFYTSESTYEQSELELPFISIRGAQFEQRQMCNI